MHLTDRAPEKRKDNYYTTQFGKFEQSLDIGREEECEAVIQPGDFFDSPNVGNHVISDTIKLLKNYNFPLYTIYGQHDISGHTETTWYRSPLRVLEEAGVLKLLKTTGTAIGGNINCYGSSFGTKTPECDDTTKFNILVIHSMIGDKELFPGQDIMKPTSFLQLYRDYNLIVCGDYHYNFSVNDALSDRKRWIVNAGCMLRKTIGQRDLDHKPGVLIYDTVANTLRRRELAVKPISEIFDLVSSTEKKKEFSDFIESLKASGKFKVGWKNILLRLLRERKTLPGVKEKLDLVMVDVLEKKDG
jgi:exonuclease SbcD